MIERTCFDSFPSWLLGDHLGSTAVVTDASGVMINETRYSAFGETRYQNGTLTTDYLYTGQRQEAEIGLYYYVARWYDPAIGRFIQADSIVPDPMRAIGFDRYAYGVNNPIKYVDPFGHAPIVQDCNFYGTCSDTNAGKERLHKPTSNFRRGGYGWDSRTHKGQDYQDTPDGDIYALTGGVVVVSDVCSAENCVDQENHTTIDYNMGYGNLVIIEHAYHILPNRIIKKFDIQENESLYSLYAHFENDDLPSVGEFVYSGEYLGEIGSTGNSTGPHLHFEIRVADAEALVFGELVSESINQWDNINDDEFYNDGWRVFEALNPNLLTFPEY